MTISRGEPENPVGNEEVVARIYDQSDRPSKLPAFPPERIDFAVIREGDVFVAACLNIDIASQGVNEEEAETNLREAISLYYSDQWEMLSQRLSRVEVVSQGSLTHA